MAREKAKQTILIDNDVMRVAEWRFAPDASTGHHRHAMDYVVVPIMMGRLLIKDSEGERYSDLVTGAPYFRKAGVEHEVINATGSEFAFIEVESK